MVVGCKNNFDDVYHMLFGIVEMVAQENPKSEYFPVVIDEFLLYCIYVQYIYMYINGILYLYIEIGRDLCNTKYKYV